MPVNPVNLSGDGEALAADGLRLLDGDDLPALIRKRDLDFGRRPEARAGR